MMKSVGTVKRAGRKRSDSGSALLVSLMVVVGLSMLGLAFVAISETESAISVNQRNSLQAQAIAEAGALAVVEWFQDPVWARSVAIVPQNATPPANMKRTRVVGTYSGVYKPLATQLLFDKPYRPAPAHRFYGDEAHADITINHTIDNTSMVNLNTYLFGSDDRVAGRITEILVYAPPMVGGTLVNGFWVGGDRFGTATIKVTAEKWSSATGGTMLASQSVRVVVGEFPMPVPGGPIQTASNAAFGGTFDVHWGNEVALGNLNSSIARTRIPWENAFDRPHFERGYDNVVWPLLTTHPDERNYFHEILGKSFEDPWAGNRARGTNTTCGNCGAYAYTSVEGQPQWAGFQAQTMTIYPTMREVTFPTIKYDTWKRIALQGRGMKGINYFQYVAGTNPPQFRRNGVGAAHGAHYWVNVRSPGAGLGPGFFFFDTIGGVNPQNIDGSTNTTVLTPAVSWSSSEFNGDFQMSGFVYFNLTQYESSGGGSTAPTLPYNMPGEIFRDVGYRKVNPSTGQWATNPDGSFVLESAGDGEWVFQDLNGNGKFDLVLTSGVTATSYDPGVQTRANQFVPKTWNPAINCTVPPSSGAAGANDCSEPHEPYLNFIYPAQNSPTGSVTVGWENPNNQTRRPRDTTSTTVPNCGLATNYDRCTSNSFDRDGALVDLPAILNGVLYNEGSYHSTGNVDYFGSVLMRGPASATGNAQVWFDEKLIKDTWSPAGMPRVIIYSMQTDEN